MIDQNERPEELNEEGKAWLEAWIDQQMLEAEAQEILFENHPEEREKCLKRLAEEQEEDLKGDWTWD